jgi:hypothetical protein
MATGRLRPDAIIGVGKANERQLRAKLETRPRQGAGTVAGLESTNL